MTSRMIKLTAVVLMTTGLPMACNETETVEENMKGESSSRPRHQKGATMAEKVVKSDEEWRQILTPEQYRIARRGGTEPPFTGEYYDFKGEGIYHCVCCDNEFFSSETKFESGTGWPSFWEPLTEGSIATAPDSSHGMIRIEAKCSRCDAHLGHLFEDGPAPTGLRYCINSAALKFKEKKGKNP